MKTPQNISNLSIAMIAGLALSAPIARAQSIASEPFAYPPGASVLGQSGGSGWVGVWQSAGYGDWKADAVGAAFAKEGMQLTTSGKRAMSSSGGIQRQLAGPPIGSPGTTLWISFVAQQTQGASTGSWLGLKLPCTGPNPFLFLGKSYGADRWGVDAGVPGSVNLSGTATSTRALIVARIDFREGLDDVAVWINPKPSLEYLLAVSPDLALAEYGDFSGIAKVVLETGSLAGEVRGFVDELRLGHAAIDVMPIVPGVSSGGARVIPQGLAHVEHQPDGSLRASHLDASAQGAIAFDLGGLDGQGYSVDVHDFLTTPGAMIRETVSDANGVSAFSSELTSIGDGLYQLNTALPGGIGSVTVGGASGETLRLNPTDPWNFHSSIPCSMSQHAVIHKVWGTREIGYFLVDPITQMWHWVTTGTQSYVRWTWVRCEPNLVAQPQIGPISWIVFESEDSDGGPNGLGGSLHSLVETQDLSELSFPNMGLHGLGQELGALGDAVVNAGCQDESVDCDFADRVVTVDNFGPSGDDGVGLAFSSPQVNQAAGFSFQSHESISQSTTGRLVTTLNVRTASGQARHLNLSMEPDGPGRVLMTFDPSELGTTQIAYAVSIDGTVVDSGQHSPSELCFSMTLDQARAEIVKWQWIRWGPQNELNPFWFESGWDGGFRDDQYVTVRGGHGGSDGLKGGHATFQFLGGDPVVAIDGISMKGRNLSGPIALANLRFESAPPSCPADFDGDGALDFFDYDAFVTAFESGDPGADFDADGTVDFFDYDAFVNAFEVGC